MGKVEIPEGLHPRWYHHRRYKANTLPAPGEKYPPLDPRGGVTVCYLENEDNETVAIGSANCSVDDPYVKQIGRDISLGRAVKAYVQEASEKRVQNAS